MVILIFLQNHVILIALLLILFHLLAFGFLQYTNSGLQQLLFFINGSFLEKRENDSHDNFFCEKFIGKFINVSDLMSSYWILYH